MTTIEIFGLVISLLGFIVFAIVFTFVYRSYTKSYIKAIKNLDEDKNILDDLIKYNHPKQKKKRKIVKAIKNVIFYGLLIILIPFFVLSIISRIRGNVLSIGDRAFLVVGSGSMSQRNNTYLDENNLNNQFDTGDIIQIKRVKNSSDLKLYDVISFRNDKGINIIHRIIKINEDGTYITRGDSNLGSDTYNPKFSDVYGVYTNTRIQKVGYLVMFFKSNFGIMTIVAVAYCIFMIDYFNKKSGERYDKRFNEIEKIVNDKNLDYAELYLKLEDDELDYESILGHKINTENDSSIKDEKNDINIDAAPAEENIIEEKIEVTDDIVEETSKDNKKENINEDETSSNNQ